VDSQVWAAHKYRYIDRRKIEGQPIDRRLGCRNNVGGRKETDRLLACKQAAAGDRLAEGRKIVRRQTGCHNSDRLVRSPQNSMRQTGRQEADRLAGDRLSGRRHTGWQETYSPTRGR
jgi:hypothetical protein